MKKLFLFFVILFSVSSFSQSFYWERILNQDYIWDLKRSSNGYLFACRQGYRGILRSTNQGLYWDEISLDPYVYKIAIDQSDYIYAGADGQWPGIYKSTDYGITWFPCYAGYVYTRSMFISSENYIYVGGYDGDFIKSTDSGLTWSSDSVTNNKITSITSTSNGQIFLTTEYGPLFTSTDYGGSWSEITVNWSASNIVSDSFNKLYISRNYHGVGISTDFGLTWNFYGSFGYPTSSSVVGIDSSNNIYYAFGKVYKSSDDGLTWIDMGGPEWVQSILTYEDKILLATYSGVYRYDPSVPPPPVYVGNNYFPLEKGVKLQYLKHSVGIDVHRYQLNSLRIEIDTVIQNNEYIFYKNKWVRYSENDKKIWIWYNDSDRVYMDFNLPPTGTFPHYTGPPYNFIATVFAGSTFLFNDTVNYKGFSWGAYTYGYYKESFGENIGPFSNSSESTAGPDGYSTESLIMAILLDSLNNPIYLTDHHKPEINLIPKTLINSNSFQLNFSVGHFYSKYFDPNSPHQGINFIKDVLFISNYTKNDSILHNDTSAAYNIPKTGQYSITFPIDTTLLQNGYALNYKVIAKDKGLIQETSFSPDSEYYQCVWDFGTSVDEENESIRRFSLSQNYPNPFNPSTKIRYTIPTPPSSSPLAKGRNEVGFVTLKVYDVLGKEIVTLVNEEKSAGSYNVEFNASHLASGIYYYQLSAGDFVETKKMVYLK